MSARDFTVRSAIHDYRVSFVEDIARSVGASLTVEDRILVDETALALHPTRFRPLLALCPHVTLAATEEQKSYDGVAPVFEWLMQSSFRRGGRLVGIGGGVTQDVTAFVSSLLYRGVEWSFAPTTLLAQGDSCIGSKTSINFRGVKNQLGGFYPPSDVFIDTSLLATLPERELRSGLGEMAHYFPIAGEQAFAGFEADLDTALTGQGLAGLVERTLSIKREYVERDEFDRGERQVFNYGHSFGHALEAVTDYRVPHGVAVAYGMDLANTVSMNLGFLDEATRNRMRRTLAKIWHGIEIGPIDLDDYEAALLRDKKNDGGNLGLILTKGFGAVFKQFVPLDGTFSRWLREYFHALSAAGAGT